ncbi:hypothetical protein [Dickeya fangzhongdai]|uniref:hypothetical protein n=1 Tax=Dickeya fangzhongdai TaxID=1778540 RepID=UPI001ADACD8A|nr:hypothetical protein [Dickeya fangzhongdai]MBO8135442.1 hypothetical protein [Dickeya fangzhongdai]
MAINGHAVFILFISTQSPIAPFPFPQRYPAIHHLSFQPNPRPKLLLNSAFITFLCPSLKKLKKTNEALTVAILSFNKLIDNITVGFYENET